MEAALDCFGVANWREAERIWLAPQAGRGSQRTFRQNILAPYLLREHQLLEASSNIAEAIEASAKTVILPILAHQISAQHRALLARVYEIKTYTEACSNEDKKANILELAVKMASRWEPPLISKWTDGMRRSLVLGPSFLFTSDRVFCMEWKLWKELISRRGLLVSSVGSEMGRRSTRVRVAATVGAVLAVTPEGGSTATKVTVTKVFKVHFMVNGAGYHTVDLIASPETGDEVGLRFPAPGVNLWHEQRGGVPRHIDDTVVRCDRLPKLAIDHIFRFVGRFDLPMHDLKDPGGLELRHKTPIHNAISYVESSPVEELAFPGRLMNPAVAGRVYREHSSGGVPLAELTKAHKQTERKAEKAVATANKRKQRSEKRPQKRQRRS